MRGSAYFLAGLGLAALLCCAPIRVHAEGDPVKGEELYHRCQGCHSIDRNRIGPMHKGIFGRTAGTVPGFSYSSAMKNSGIVWNEDTLDRFLENPRHLVPGTKMAYAGIKDAKDRADLIAYLKQVTKP